MIGYVPEGGKYPEPGHGCMPQRRRVYPFGLSRAAARDDLSVSGVILPPTTKSARRRSPLRSV